MTDIEEMIELAKSRAPIHKAITDSNYNRQRKFLKEKVLAQNKAIGKYKERLKNQHAMMTQVNDRRRQLEEDFARLKMRLTRQEENIQRMLKAIEMALGKEALEKFKYYLDRV